MCPYSSLHHKLLDSFRTETTVLRNDSTFYAASAFTTRVAYPTRLLCNPGIAKTPTLFRRFLLALAVEVIWSLLLRISPDPCFLLVVNFTVLVWAPWIFGRQPCVRPSLRPTSLFGCIWGRLHCAGWHRVDHFRCSPLSLTCYCRLVWGGCVAWTIRRIVHRQ